MASKNCNQLQSSTHRNTSVRIVHIPRSIDDDFYRYNMPELNIIIEGSSAKTILDNLNDVAKALHCEPLLILKFFGFRLGTNIMCKNNKYIICGIVANDTLAQYLDDFIEKYILCCTCLLPEITLSKTTTRIKKLCMACGGMECISPHNKFETYMLKSIK